MSRQMTTSQPRSRATLSRIASDAEVSMSTVSKVLNGRGGVSDTTRSRVEALLAEHGYNRRRAEQSAPLVELVFSAVDSYWALEIIQGAHREAQKNGLSLVLTESGDRHSPGPEWIEGVLQRRPAGVILVFSDLSREHKAKLRTRNIPFVVLDPAGDPAPDVPSVGCANWSGGVLAIRHLVSLGHRDIAIISGPEDMLSSRARVSGYRSALETAGIPIRREYIVQGDFHPDDGTALGRQLLTLPEPPTAIFAGNDLQALGVYEAARALGLTIPEDVSVVGFDDLQLSQWTGPALTTIRQPLIEMAEQATRLVVGLHNGEAPDANLRIDLATTLIVRSSTAPPRA